MKKKLLALLAALLLLSLAACGAAPETAPSDDIAAPPAQETPEASAPADTPETPAEPEPETPAETPDETPAQTPPEETPEAPPEESETPVFSYREEPREFTTEDGAPAVTLARTGLTVHTGSAEADAVINAYYEGVFQKLADLCAGELTELSENGQYHYRVTMDAELARYDDEMISIARTVTITGEETGLTDTVLAGETFRLSDGGLLTADDFFAVDAEVYTQRLVQAVRQQISEDPYHDQTYFAQWEDMAERAFNRDQFYVTDDAYVVFYQANELGGAAERVYSIPWSQLEDLLP